MTGSMPAADGDRRAEIAAGLQAVRTRIEAACADAARRPEEVELVVVTKTFPVTDVRLLADLGVRHVGENRDQEARPKLTDALLEGSGLTRHFIGQLQTNKVASVLSYADVVHTVDRPRLLRVLARVAAEHGRRPRVLVQVDLDTRRGGETGRTSRGGAGVAEVRDLADAVAAEPSLVLGGVMAVAPLGADPDAAFTRLRRVAEDVRADHPAATWISAGMSGDLEAAIRHGATHLRVGSAILGTRPALR